MRRTKIAKNFPCSLLTMRYPMPATIASTLTKNDSPSHCLALFFVFFLIVVVVVFVSFLRHRPMSNFDLQSCAQIERMTRPSIAHAVTRHSHAACTTRSIFICQQMNNRVRPATGLEFQSVCFPNIETAELKHLCSTLPVYHMRWCMHAAHAVRVHTAYAFCHNHLCNIYAHQMSHALGQHHLECHKSITIFDNLKIHTNAGMKNIETVRSDECETVHQWSIEKFKHLTCSTIDTDFWHVPTNIAKKKMRPLPHACSIGEENEAMQPKNERNFHFFRFRRVSSIL